MDTSAAQLSRLSDEVRSTKGLAEGYQKELANLQRSLNIKVDSSRDLAAQIADLGQSMRKLQKDAEGYTNQIASLRTSLENQQAISTKLAGETEELKAANKQLQGTISALTSKEDSRTPKINSTILPRRYRVSAPGLWRRKPETEFPQSSPSCR
jgi:chromosome segregation ATPase